MKNIFEEPTIQVIKQDNGEYYNEQPGTNPGTESNQDKDIWT